MNMTSKGGIIGWFAANPVAANLLLLLVIAMGIIALPDLRREAFPSRSPENLTITVNYNSGSAKQSEEGLAIPIEEALQGMPGVDTITSQSNGSGVRITVKKQSAADLDELLTDTKSRVDAINGFPSDANKPVIKKSEREHDAISLQLFGDASRQTLQQLSSALKTDLLAHDNINRVSVSGYLDPLLSIEIDEARLQSLGLTLNDLQAAINAGSSSPTSAVIRSDTAYLQLEASQQAYQTAEFANITLLNTRDGRLIRVGDVATIREDWDDTKSALSRFNGQPSIGMDVVTTGLDDIGHTAEAALQIVNEWHELGKLPAGVELAAWNDRSVSIKSRLSLLTKNAATGVVLVFLLLAVFLNLTVAFWVAMGLPFVFFGTFYIMGDNVMGLSLNEFTTFGFILALGIVVDDAVVVGESIYSVRSKHGDTLENTIEGVNRVAVPTLFGVLTTVAAFYTLSMVEGGLGNLYAQFAAVVAICLLFSVVESKLILPAHLAHLNTHRHDDGNVISRSWRKIQNAANALLDGFSSKIYRPSIEIALNYRYAVIILFIAFALAVLALPIKGIVHVSFFPDIPGDSVRVALTMHSDAPVGLTHRNLKVLEQQAYAIDEEMRGAGSDETAIANLEILSSSDQAGRIKIELTPNSPYSLADFSREWRTMAGLPEGAKTLSVQSRRGGGVSGFRIELRAADDEVLNRAGETVRSVLESYTAVSGIEDNLTPSQPQMRLTLTPQGEAAGITTAMLAKQIHQAFNGQVVQSFQRNADEVEVRVRYPQADRQNPADVLNASIRSADGTVFPLSVVANIESGFSRGAITRINNKRSAYLQAEVDKEIMSSTALVEDLQKNMVPQLRQQYPGLDIEFAGEAKEQAETAASMESMFLLAMLIIYMLLAIPLKSYIQPILIMTAIPFGIVGAIIGHWMNDISLGILSFNGMVALAGVVVNDSLLLVSRFNDVKPDTEHIHDAIVEACMSRLRAVLLTSFTTFAGLVPLLSETDRQAQFLIPAAVSLAYGIMFATLITLVLIPSLLMIQHDAQAGLLRIGRLFSGEKGATTSC